ncbi:MAG: hypothetical protein KC503_36710 [Myxococcales bacterium]|nr:hypothetical protein [Myxococcales bacterium]
MTSDGFPPIGEIVPHGEAMVLLDELVSWQPGRATCRVTLREGARFVVDGAVDAVVGIEYMAQAVAACLGYEALRGGAGVRVGVIIACRRFDLHAQTLPLGEPLAVSVARTRGNDRLSHFDGAIGRERDGEGGAPLVEATLTLYHAESPPDDD